MVEISIQIYKDDNNFPEVLLYISGHGARLNIEEKLEQMYQASCTQHAEMSKKISTMERFKDKWMYTFGGGMIVVSWASAHADSIISILK
jgi:hypothetical protein